MEGTAFNPKKIRTFYRGDNHHELAAVRVNALRGDGKSLSCEIDQKTGTIQLPNSVLSWRNVRSNEDLKFNKSERVKAFEVTILCHPDEPVVIAQRKDGTNTYRGGHVLNGGDLLEHHLPPCEISHFNDHMFGFGVWTQPMNRDGANRYDLWSVDPNGFIELTVLYVLTLDNTGDNFQIVSQQRWVGNVYRRKSDTSYQLPPNADKRATEVFNDPAARKVLDQFVFVPGEHSEDFSSRMQILLDSKFRDLLASLDNLEFWDDRETFWVERKPEVELKPNQAVVKFLTYGVGRGSFGILNLMSPVKLFGKTYNALQFDHHSVRVDEGAYDEQGLISLPPGTIVEWRQSVDMGLQKDRVTPHPAKVLEVIPLYHPAAIDPRETEVNKLEQVD